MVELVDGIRRVTFPLPLGIDHVHCYLLRGEGGWTVVDTGLGLPQILERWRGLLADLDAPVERIVITHMHPDHVGGAADVAALSGAPVYQGRVDHEQAANVWGPARPVGLWTEHMRAHGTPEALIEAILADSEALRPHVHMAWEVEPLEDGDRLGAWLVVHLPGHADGHLALYRDDGVLIAGDAILGGITPTVGLWPNARPDPLGDFQASLRRLIALEPRLALAGHGQPIDDPVGRAHALLAHHDDRLGLTVEALAAGPRNAYDISLALFPSALPPSQRRFALAETLSHLERLVLDGGAVRVDGGYAAA